MPAIFDRSALLDRLFGDEDLARTVIEIFLSDTPGQIGILKNYITQGRAEQAREQSHKIKGAAGNIGGVALQQIASEMEKAGAAVDLGKLEGLMPQLEREFERLKQAVKEV